MRNHRDPLETWTANTCADDCEGLHVDLRPDARRSTLPLEFDPIVEANLRGLTASVRKEKTPINTHVHNCHRNAYLEC